MIVAVNVWQPALPDRLQICPCVLNGGPHALLEWTNIMADAGCHYMHYCSRCECRINNERILFSAQVQQKYSEESHLSGVGGVAGAAQMQQFLLK